MSIVQLKHSFESIQEIIINYFGMIFLLIYHINNSKMTNYKKKCKFTHSLFVYRSIYTGKKKKKM